MKRTTPSSPFSTRLSGSAKETELRIRNIVQWKKKRPPVVLFVLTLVVLLSCFGLFSCQVKPLEVAVDNSPAAEVVKPAEIFGPNTEQDKGTFAEEGIQYGAEQTEDVITDYFSSKLSQLSPDTPLVITERQSFDWNGTTVIAATATNIVVADFEANLLRADGPHTEPNLPERENTVMYLMSALFIDGQEPIDLMLDAVCEISKTPLGQDTSGISYDYGEEASFQQFLSVIQYKSGKMLTTCPVFCNHGGELLIRDYKYRPVYSLEDADGDGEAEFVFFRDRSSSLYTKYVVYDWVNGTIQRTSDVLNEYRNFTEQKSQPQAGVSLESLLTEDDYVLAVPDFLNLEQQMLYRKANNLYRHAFGAYTSAVEYPETTGTSDYPVITERQKLEENGYTYVKAQGPYSEWADFNVVIHSVFTDTFFRAKNKTPLYVEHDGLLYFLDVGRGCGYYYNDNFPDEFRLISRTDTAIEFVLIGHYSQAWPNEGETTQERNERLERGYEYTYEFPITMVLTEDGWRFDQFYSALTDEVGPESALKQNKDARSLYRGIMLGSGAFTLDGSVTALKDYFSYIGADGNTHYRRPGEFSVLDLDGDGRTEVVIAANDNQYALILREENGAVYGYVRYIRQFNTLTLKQDGTFNWSNGAFDNGTGRIRFEENIYTLGDRIIRESTVIDWITYCQSDGYDEEGNLKKYFYVDRQPATIPEYQAAEAQQEAKPDAVWYDFTEENINAQLDS